MESIRTTPLAHWRLSRWPFPSMAGAAQFYPTAGHDEALARLEYLVDARRRLGALIGTSGAGKSLLMEVATRRLSRGGRAAVTVNALGLSSRELLWQIAAGLGASPGADADMPRLWRMVTDRVAENRWQQAATVLLVDDAGQIGPDAAIQLVRLARLDTSPGARWTIVLAAEPEQAVRWSTTLKELVDLRIELDPWETDDTVGFVQNALVEGGSCEPLFTNEALATVQELSDGNPRRVTRLADFALLAGAAAHAERIDAGHVRAAWEEIAWPEAAGTF